MANNGTLTRFSAVVVGTIVLLFSGGCQCWLPLTSSAFGSSFGRPPRQLRFSAASKTRPPRSRQVARRGQGDDGANVAVLVGKQSVWEALGIPIGDDKAKLKKGYKQFVRQNHPDVAGDRAMDRAQFGQISDAYKALMQVDPELWWFETFTARVDQMNKEREERWLKRAELKQQEYLDRMQAQGFDIEEMTRELTDEEVFDQLAERAAAGKIAQQKAYEPFVFVFLMVASFIFFSFLYLVVSNFLWFK